MDWAEYLENAFLIDDEYMADDYSIVDELDYFYDFSTTAACPMYDSCPYVDDCRVFSGDCSATCSLMGGDETNKSRMSEV